jgi:hypothetical protein
VRLLLSFSRFFGLKDLPTGKNSQPMQGEESAHTNLLLAKLLLTHEARGHIKLSSADSPIRLNLSSHIHDGKPAVVQV